MQQACYFRLMLLGKNGQQNLTVNLQTSLLTCTDILTGFNTRTAN
jgi:hypothetical protein